jgi:hypothetical protein
MDDNVRSASSGGPCHQGTLVWTTEPRRFSEDQFAQVVTVHCMGRIADYVIDLLDEIIGENAAREQRFPWAVGDLSPRTGHRVALRLMPCGLRSA